MSNGYENKINQLVKEISINYRQEQSIIPQNPGPLPNRDCIIAIGMQLRQLLFPGYFGKRNFEGETREHHIGQLLTDIYEALSEQVAFALTYEALENEFKPEDIKIKADRICLEFLSKIPRIREYLATDVEAAFEGDPAASSKDEIIFSYPGLFAVSIYRLAHELYLLSVPLIPRILTEHAHSITGIDIHPGATIGKYFFIDHGTGVVVGETTLIGDHVKIYQGVTLGALSTRGGQALRGVRRHPTLEDGVTVYSGASILGGDTVIGSGAVIGSNVFITKSVPLSTQVSNKTPELVFKNHKQEKKSFDSFDWMI